MNFIRTLNWPKIVGETLIIIVGVFVGVQASNWNEERLEKAETVRLLEQFQPELANQVELYDTNVRYYKTTRRYAEQAFAGWRRDPTVSDGQFVIAAYQASQITGIGLNADAWSLTFGGEQIRRIDDPTLRRQLEVILTADYSSVDFRSVATAYREQVRHVIPNDVQDDIRRVCGDRNREIANGFSVVDLPENCGLNIPPQRAAAIAAALRARSDLPQELNWHLAAVATYLQNFDGLIRPMRVLLEELRSSNDG